MTAKDTKAMIELAARTRSTFYCDGYRDAACHDSSGYSAPDVPVYAMEYQNGYLDRMMDDRGCSRNCAKIHAGIDN